jgi:hypothetical protein
MEPKTDSRARGVRYDLRVVIASRLLARIVACAVLIGLVADAWHEARACSPPKPGLQFRWVWPESGSVVPTNVRPVVFYVGAEPIYGWTSGQSDGPQPILGQDVGLREKEGGEVTVGISVAPGFGNTRDGALTTAFAVLVSAKTALAPGKTYELFDRRPTIPCGPYDPVSCTAGDINVVATFTTGTEADRTPPAFAGLVEVLARNPIFCPDSGCCGPQRMPPWSKRTPMRLRTMPPSTIPEARSRSRARTSL